MRICLVGCGRWGRMILRDLNVLGASVHVVAPHDVTRRDATANGAASASPDCEGAEVRSVDGFVVATPTVFHAETIEKLLPFEKPIFVEKPLTCDSGDARRLTRMAGDRIFVMDKWRYHRGVETLRDLATSGALGQVHSVRSYRLGWSVPHTDVDAVWTLLPHDLAIAYEILRRLPESRAAYTTAPTDPGSDLTAVLGGGAEPLVMAEVSARHPVSRRAVIVCGSRATASLTDSYADSIALREAAPGDTAQLRQIPIAADMPLERELRAFLDYLKGGPPPRSSAAEGLMVVERIAALRQMVGLE